MIDQKTDLKSLTRELKIYPQVLVNVRVKDKEESLSNEKLNAKIDQITKELGDSGRVLVRASGTEPLIRVMVEASSNELAETYANQIKDEMVNLGLAL